jgi:hypothetical protein
MIKRLALLAFFTLGPLVISVPAQVSDSVAPFNPDLVVARVGESQLTLGQMYTIVQTQPVYRSNPVDDDIRRKKMLEGLIDDQLVSLDARTISLKDNHGAVARIRRGVTVVAANLYTQEVIAEKLQIDSATIDTFYHNHISRYSSVRDQRRARVITVWKEGKAPGKGMIEYVDSLYLGWYPEDKIDSIYTRLSEGEDFGVLAAKHSEDPITKGRGGDLGWVSEQSLGPGVFTERVMNQPLYMFSKPFETNDAWHIVQVTADRPAGPVPLDAEIGAEIVTHLVDQQKTKMLKEIGDSLVAVAKIDWSDEYTDLPHDQLKNEMILVIVNNRDTIFAEEFLLEQFKWLDRESNQLPDATRRADILRGEYIRYLCWYGFLRERGYLERPGVKYEKERLIMSEREALVRSRIAATPIPEPDSAAIQKYYQDSIHLYGTAPNALNAAWNSIKAKLMSDARDAAHLRWRKAASARHGVTRDLDNLALLPFVEPKLKK